MCLYKCEDIIKLIACCFKQLFQVLPPPSFTSCLPGDGRMVEN